MRRHRIRRRRPHPALYRQTLLDLDDDLAYLPRRALKGHGFSRADRHPFFLFVIPSGASALFSTRGFCGWADAESRDLLFVRSSTIVDPGHGRQHPLRNLVARVRLIQWHPLVVAANLNPQARHHVDAHDVMQRQSLIHRAQLMKPVRPPRPIFSPRLIFANEGTLIIGARRCRAARPLSLLALQHRKEANHVRVVSGHDVP